MPSKPQRLRPLDPKQKAAFWVSIIFAALIIIVGWGITLREVVKEEVPLIQDRFGEAVDGAAGVLGELTEETEGEAIEVKNDAKMLIELYQTVISGEEPDEALIQELTEKTEEITDTSTTSAIEE